MNSFLDAFSQNIQSLSIQLVPFVMAVVFHEYAHGLAAYYWGDRTAKDEGRLTLNPIPHLDLIGTVIFPVITMLSGAHFLIGWAKPMPINSNRFRKYKAGVLSVSMAGVGVNFLLGWLSALLCILIQVFVPKTFYLYEPLSKMTYFSVALNYMLALFNLIPLPPLDGSKILEVLLPYRLSQQYKSIEAYSSFIFMALLISGFLRFLSYPISIFRILTFQSIHWLFSALGIQL